MHWARRRKTLGGLLRRQRRVCILVCPFDENGPPVRPFAWRFPSIKDKIRTCMLRSALIDAINDLPTS
jgi:hypothetical protein